MIHPFERAIDWVHRQLDHTERIVKKPLLGPLLSLVWQYARASDSQQGEAVVLTAVLETLIRRPILYQDQYGLEYLLYPGQNAQVYFNNQGNYEVRETRFCLQYVRSGMVAFDVGAHIGLYSLLLAKLVGPEGQVHAFEPESRNYRRLLANLAINSFDHVRANRLAVFSDSQMLQLNVFLNSVNAWHSLGHPSLPDPYHPGHTLTPSEQQEVQGTSLDDYCASAGITEIDFLKVDVEGAELEVLQGAERLLQAGAIAAVLFEVSLPQVQAMGHQPAEIFALLQSFGFRSFPLSEDGELLPEVETTQADYQNLVALRDEDTARRLAVGT